MKITIFFLVAAIVAVGVIPTILEQQHAAAAIGFDCSRVHTHNAVCTNLSTDKKCVFTSKGEHGSGCP